mmetsp:Transcript_10988/g.5577  ORF Transcript_10988/g.5577 Transcript_10988/m.5577 type:complete len:98 (-) Transcript_10988:143-436(-)
MVKGMGEVWEVGKALWKHDYNQSFVHLTKCSSVRLANEFHEFLTKKVIRLISQAFACISLEDMSKLLGIKEQNGIALARANNWRIDGKWVHPKEEIS